MTVLNFGAAYCIRMTPCFFGLTTLTPELANARQRCVDTLQPVRLRTKELVVKTMIDWKEMIGCSTILPADHATVSIAAHNRISIYAAGTKA